MQQNFIRNFAIIAHVDHGKSTLADRLLEITGTVAKEKLGEQFLDKSPISRQRGITIKLAPARMRYQTPNSNTQNKLEFGALGTSDVSSDLEFSSSEFILNLIDTPGHVDFSYEVSRTLAACEGVLLLVDATQGIQAQTVAHYHTAKRLGLTFIPVVNKIDMESAQPEEVAKDMMKTFGFAYEEILFISAKTGEGVSDVLDTIVKRIPEPSGNGAAPLRALIFDATYDEHKGIIAFIRIVDGFLHKGDQIHFFQTDILAPVLETGYFSPELTPSDTLRVGEIGYVTTGVKDIRLCRVGDTIINEKLKTKNEKFISESGDSVEPLPGYTTPKPMVFYGMYPKDVGELPLLRTSLQKLLLSDASLTFSEEYSSYLGSGFRVGFLGLLHAEIVKERLTQEFGIEPLLTMPHVLYEEKGGIMMEPYMKLTVFVPKHFVGAVLALCQQRKGTLFDMVYHEQYAVLTFDMPFSMFIRNLSADLKSVSEGYASIDYELVGYKEAALTKLEVRINDNPIDVLSEYVYNDEASHIARKKVEKLKEVLSRQQFRQIVQCLADNRVLAREEIPPFRKDVLAKMSGGDRTRKDKLLDKQKKGKKRMNISGKINLSQDALLSMMRQG